MSLIRIMVFVLLIICTEWVGDVYADSPCNLSSSIQTLFKELTVDQERLRAALQAPITTDDKLVGHGVYSASADVSQVYLMFLQSCAVRYYVTDMKKEVEADKYIFETLKNYSGLIPTARDVINQLIPTIKNKHVVTLAESIEKHVLDGKELFDKLESLSH